MSYNNIVTIGRLMRLIYEKLPCEVAACEKFTEVVALFLYLGLGPPLSFQCTGTELDSCSSPPL